MTIDQKTLKSTDFWQLALIALMTTLGIQVVRALFPLTIFNTAFDGLSISSRTILAGCLAIVFLSPFFVPFLLGLLKFQRSIFLVVGGLALVRLILQVSLSVESNFFLAILASVFALMALPLGFAWINTVNPAGGHHFAVGIILGLAIDAALNTAFQTWDYVWRRDAVSLVISLILCGGVAVLLWRLRATFAIVPRESGFRNMLPLALIGPFFMLHLTFLHNPGFIISVSDFGLFTVGAVILLMDAAILYGSEAILRGWAISWVRLIVIIGIIPLFFFLNELRGPINSGDLIPLAQAITCWLLISTLADLTTTAENPLMVRTSVSMGLGSLLFIGLVLAQHIGYEFPVSPYVPNIVQAIAGGLLVIPFLTKKIGVSRLPLDRRLALIPLALIISPLGALLTAPAFTVQTPATRGFRLMTYNIHQGADVFGWINPEAIAEAIEAQHPDVVVIQEMIRGQLVTGSVDVASWLGRRLNMAYVFAPATDSTYGEALYTRLPILSWKAGVLPQDGAAQPRAYILARLDLGPTDVTVIGSHLDHISSKVRLVQAAALISQAWNGAPHTIIAGDMNSTPNAPEIALFGAAGLISAQDKLGKADLMTFDSLSPVARIDWVFGSPDLAFSALVIPRTTASDHLPVAVSVSLP